MNTSPTIEEMLDGVILAITNDILPNLEVPKAVASAAMMQSLLQGIKQMVPVYDGYVVEEHNAMPAVFANAAAALEGVDGEAADRIRERASQFSSVEEVPAPPEMGPVRAAHREMSMALRDTIIDIDELQRAGIPGADEASNAVRTHLGPRLARDAATISIEGGMIGRG